jgi:hypothetical protein
LAFPVYAAFILVPDFAMFSRRITRGEAQGRHIGGALAAKNPTQWSAV